MFPSIGIFDREVKEEMEIGGVRLEKGTCVAAQWPSFLFNPNNFDSPLEFNPERWEN